MDYDSNGNRISETEPQSLPESYMDPNQAPWPQRDCLQAEEMRMDIVRQLEQRRPVSI
jgi:hypothetical protein